MIITIDGNIGSGKSTLLENLNKNNFEIDLEPVKDWEPFLTDMYENNRDAFEFQIKVWTDRCFIPDYPKNKITCVERSAHYQWYVFSIANFNNNKLNERQMNILATLYQRPSFKPDLMIYLRSDPQKCMERIHKRHRNCEMGLSFDYVNHLHELHELAYSNLTHQHRVCVDIEGKEIEEINKEINDIIKKYTHIYNSIKHEQW